jgi:drug/metabolite transporter (DMT)-like permease
LQGGTGGQDPENRLGIILALSTSLIWSVYFIYNARDSRDPLVRLFLNFVFASIYLVIGAVLKGSGFTGTLEGWATAIYVGIFEMGITFVLWLLAMQHATSNDRISNLVYMAPFLNLIWVNLVLDEHIFMTTVFGVLLLVSGIVMQNLIRKDAKTA